MACRRGELEDLSLPPELPAGEPLPLPSGCSQAGADGWLRIVSAPWSQALAGTPIADSRAIVCPATDVVMYARELAIRVMAGSWPILSALW
jgi:hypothetical protein